jgi:protein O-GlcNAc transferase
MDAACDYFEKALAAEPTLYGARGMRLLANLYRHSSDSAALRELQQEWAGQRATGVKQPVFKNDLSPDWPLRIGFISSDFRAHSVGFNMLPLYQRLDRQAFRLHAYAEVANPDAATHLFKEASDVWRSTVGMTDAEVAQTVTEDKIDILVILAGHLDENRPYVARYRCAPVQVSHHDICTSGMAEIDYFIGDSFVMPRDGAEWFSERVLRLPNFTVHSIPAEAGDPGSLPVLTNKHITFGSFNAPQKISDRCLDAWAALLHAVPGSHLILAHFEAYSETATRERVIGRIADRGIGRDRVSVLESVDLRSAHLRAYDQIDIALDPFPFSGATTTFEALLMGVPVISLAGDRFVSRCSAATLQAAGLGVWIADDVESYVSRAVVLATDIDRLAAIRMRVRQAVTQSRVCDADRYARNMGRIYRAIWRRWCSQSTV